MAFRKPSDYLFLYSQTFRDVIFPIFVGLPIFCCWKDTPTPYVICANLQKKKSKYRYCGGERFKTCAWFSLAFLYFFIPWIMCLNFSCKAAWGGSCPLVSGDLWPLGKAVRMLRRVNHSPQAFQESFLSLQNFLYHKAWQVSGCCWWCLRHYFGVASLCCVISQLDCNLPEKIHIVHVTHTFVWDWKKLVRTMQNHSKVLLSWDFRVIHWRSMDDFSGLSRCGCQLMLSSPGWQWGGVFMYYSVVVVFFLFLQWSECETVGGTGFVRRHGCRATVQVR